jgi:glycosyltransferase involved in cell wall biosynthesis
MMSQQLDIAIAPLKDMEFNYYKSPIKFLEYSAMKVPTVAAKIPPYSDIIKNEKTGMLYNTPEEFYKAVLRLIEAPYARKNLAENAYKFVKGNYDARKRAGDLAIIYQNAIDRRNGKNKNNG